MGVSWRDMAHWKNPEPLGEWHYIDKGEYPDINKTILAWTIFNSYMILKDYMHEGKYRNVWTGTVITNRDVFTGKVDLFEKIVAWVYLDEEAHYVAPTVDGQFIKADKVAKYNENYYKRLAEEEDDEMENGEEEE